MQTMKWKTECGKVTCHLPVGLLLSAHCIKEWDEGAEAWTCRDTATGMLGRCPCQPGDQVEGQAQVDDQAFDLGFRVGAGAPSSSGWSTLKGSALLSHGTLLRSPQQPVTVSMSVTYCLCLAQEKTPGGVLTHVVQTPACSEHATFVW